MLDGVHCAPLLLCLCEFEHRLDTYRHLFCSSGPSQQLLLQGHSFQCSPYIACACTGDSQMVLNKPGPSSAPVVSILYK